MFLRTIFLSSLKQRNLSYSHYEKFLHKISSAEFQVLPLRDISQADPKKIVICLRHDIDYDLRGALKMAEIEHSFGFSGTYFILHTARYFNHPGFLTYLHILQDRFGHEIGWHHNIHGICCQKNSINPVKYMNEKLRWLRDNDIKISGFANHVGQQGFCFGNYRDYFDYDAYNIKNLSFKGNSDCEFHNHQRWSPEDLNLENKHEGEKIGILLHPVHWTNKESILRHQLKYLYFSVNY